MQTIIEPVTHVLPEFIILGEVPEELIDAVHPAVYKNELEKTRERAYLRIGHYMLDQAREYGLRTGRNVSMWAAAAKIMPGDSGHYKWHDDSTLHLLSTSWGLTTEQLTGTYTNEELDDAVNALKFDIRKKDSEHTLLQALLNECGTEPVMKRLPGLSVYKLPDRAIAYDPRGDLTATHRSPVNTTGHLVTRGFCAVILAPKWGFLPVKEMKTAS